ncbi:cytochrome b/b6 domain-containing protein [Arthrobacter sp. ISL-72]|uniref:cytochrome b/b6 domain-containing protein n=1 Tax=Arthrobacter sp. ISL-72 TaxID=2819114 RepID=UPI001BE5980F|nr:cytochrome b/b6 domain-containing protein [Arthrobacter sp. ISL-72]MBT2597846.1 cytochrome b/b6 domain-containing protein [Arthrobacter sp. ISL-72]
MSTLAPKKPAQKNKWLRFSATAVGAISALGILVLLARWLMAEPAVQGFVAEYPGNGTLPRDTPEGLPAWLNWQHFFNAFFIVLIIRTGWQVRTSTRPSGQWTRNNSGFLRTKRPPKKISLDLWLHLTLDTLWVLNGAIYIVLLFATGHWMRILPTSLDVFPNALSALLQYAAFDWPLENGWIHYNALQLLSYFATVFIAAPLAIISGLRMSGAWPQSAARINKVYPVELARRIHVPVMVYFVLFTVVHVTLVFVTGALQNLNHMFAARDDDGLLGFGLFALALLAIIGSWFLARPLFLRPIASLMGKVSR